MLKPRAVGLLPVCLTVKPVGEPDAGDRHVRFVRVGDRSAGRIERELAGNGLVHQDDGDQHHDRRDAGDDESNDAQSLSVGHDTIPYPLADSL